MLIAEFQELADTVLGSRLSALKGGGRDNDGLVHDMRQVKDDVAVIRETNGEQTLRTSTPQKVAAAIVAVLLILREVL